jgi:hypothetical protein
MLSARALAHATAELIMGNQAGEHARAPSTSSYT